MDGGARDASSRRGRLLVDAETDLVYIRRCGVVREPGCATVGFLTPGTSMLFYVDQGGRVVFLEHLGGPRTWSAVVERKARRGAT